MRVTRPPNDARHVFHDHESIPEKIRASVYELITAFEAYVEAAAARAESERRK